MKRVRVAVLGYGHLGKWHCQKVEACKEQADFVAIVEKFPAAQEAAKANHPNVKIVSDIKEVLDQIDAAFIITPTSTHFELVKFLLENNKHVFCEKPLCSSSAEAAELQKMAQRSQLILQVGHSERFHEAWEKIRNTLYSLPTPYTVKINRVAPFKGRATDVDVVQDLGIHDLDLLLFLFKQKPTEVSARGFKIRTTKWDHADIHLKLEQGCEALVTVGRNAIREVRELEVVSKDGMLAVDLFSNKIIEATSSKFEDDTFVREQSYQKTDHLLLEHQNFYQSVLTNSPAIIGLKDGVNAVNLVDATLRALDSGTSIKVVIE
jgi:predicted dehydrogenase